MKSTPTVPVLLLKNKLKKQHKRLLPPKLSRKLNTKESIAHSRDKCTKITADPTTLVMASKWEVSTKWSNKSKKKNNSSLPELRNKTNKKPWRLAWEPNITKSTRRSKVVNSMNSTASSTINRAENLIQKMEMKLLRKTDRWKMISHQTKKISPKFTKKSI